ncbi:MAG: hypothetical protein KDA36_08605, partial [Planctomycetaceae bacterium]|nr:hypothetical protein [Planctomycetaceae bacterium]
MRSPAREEFQPIIDHITQNISPNSWVENGGSAQYELLLIEHRLYVFSTREVHKQIEQYLKSIWRSPAGRTEKQALSTSDSSAAPGEPGYTPPSLGLSTIVAHDLVTPTGKDPLGRPIATREDYEKIIAILKEIEPQSWESNGGKGKIEYSLLMGTIYFQNSGEVSYQISERLELLLLSKNSSAHPLPALPANAVVEPVSNEKIATNPSAPPVPSPAPALPGSVQSSLVGVVRSDKPADPNASYQLHLTSFVKIPETADRPSEILSETPAEPVLLQNHESKNISRPFQRTYLNGTYIEKVPQAQVTASIVRFDDYLNLFRVRLIVKRDGADASIRGWVDSTVEISLNHKLELVLERDDQKRPVHWLVFGVTEPNAPPPVVYAMNPPSIDHLLISSYSTVGSSSTSQMRVKSHRLPERFWIKPGEPIVAMHSPTRKDFQPIIDHITQKFAPDSWSDKGGPAQYELLLLDHSLVVFSTVEVHGQIEEYLKSIQHAPAGQKEKHTLTLSFGLSG